MDKIKVSKLMSELHDLDGQGLKLWLTPGSFRPYWASNANFTYDVCIAIPRDFLEQAGFTAFVEDGDYSGCDERLVMEFDFVPAETE